MIPISDDNPARLTPLVTWGIILVCVAVFIWELSLGRAMDPALALLGFTPAALGHALAPPPGYVAVPAWATIFTSMFLHGGFLHIGGNMLYLWIFGNNVEDAMGHARYLLFYLICGVVAALTLAAINPASAAPMIGASGAISGVLAAYVLLYPRARVTVIVPLGIILYPMKISAIWVVGFWFLLQLLSAALAGHGDSNIAWWAHVGGFVAGGILTPFFKLAQFRLFGDVRRGPWG
jgi:membrane associated rhomboid family serine protease